MIVSRTFYTPTYESSTWARNSVILRPVKEICSFTILRKFLCSVPNSIVGSMRSGRSFRFKESRKFPWRNPGWRNHGFTDMAHSMWQSKPKQYIPCVDGVTEAWSALSHLSVLPYRCSRLLHLLQPLQLANYVILRLVRNNNTILSMYKRFGLQCSKFQFPLPVQCVLLIHIEAERFDRFRFKESWICRDCAYSVWTFPFYRERAWTKEPRKTKNRKPVNQSEPAWAIFWQEERGFCLSCSPSLP